MLMPLLVRAPVFVCVLVTAVRASQSPNVDGTCARCLARTDAADI